MFFYQNKHLLMLFLLTQLISVLYYFFTDFPYNYGTKLRYMAITINTTIDNDAGFVTGNKFKTAWEDFATEEVGTIIALEMYTSFTDPVIYNISNSSFIRLSFVYLIH